MERKEVAFKEIYDVRAVRVIVDDSPMCYHALGIIHSLWRPIPGQFDDYIATPKDNFYQSLHTAVLYDERQAAGSADSHAGDAPTTPSMALPRTGATRKARAATRSTRSASTGCAS